MFYDLRKVFSSHEILLKNSERALQYILKKTIRVLTASWTKEKERPQLMRNLRCVAKKYILENTK